MLEMFTKAVPCPRCREADVYVAVAHDVESGVVHDEGVLATDCTCKLTPTDEGVAAARAVRHTLRELRDRARDRVAVRPPAPSGATAYIVREFYTCGHRYDMAVAVTERA